MATKINSDMKCVECGCDIDLNELHRNVVEFEDPEIDDASVCDLCYDESIMGDNYAAITEDRKAFVYTGTMQ
jgi:hypothetical protein